MAFKFWERAIRTGAAGSDYDNAKERFKPNLCFNIHQSPLSFARDVTRTYEEVRKGSTSENLNKKTWMPQPNTGDSKRLCTLNVCFFPSGQQPRLAIASREKSKRLSAVKKASWDKDVDVFFQATNRFRIFLDKHEAQIQESFRNSVKDLGKIPCFGVPGATHMSDCWWWWRFNSQEID